MAHSMRDVMEVEVDGLINFLYLKAVNQCCFIYDVPKATYANC